MNWFLGALGVETVACWLQSKMDSSRVSLIRCRLNQQSHEAMLPISNIQKTIKTLSTRVYWAFIRYRYFITRVCFFPSLFNGHLFNVYVL